MRKLWGTVVGITMALTILGAVHIYASNTVTETLNQTMQGTSINHIAMINRLQNPTREIYRVSLKIENPTLNKVRVSLTNLQVLIDEYSFVLVPLGTWERDINPGGSTQFEGDFTIYSSTLSDLRSREEVTFHLQGDMEASAGNLWVRKTIEQPLNKTIKTMFD